MNNIYNLGPLRAIPPGEGREFTVAGRRITIFHLRGGAVYATQASCPHRQGPLADGLVGGTTVVCPYHAWKFDLTSGKGLPTNPGPDCLQTYPVTLDGEGEILLTLPADADGLTADDAADARLCKTF